MCVCVFCGVQVVTAMRLYILVSKTVKGKSVLSVDSSDNYMRIHSIESPSEREVCVCV